MLATALAIKLEDGGPVFYKSERIGKKGKPYKVWKFRSMCIDAEEKIQALIKETGGQSLLFKMKDDLTTFSSHRIYRILTKILYNPFK